MSDTETANYLFVGNPGSGKSTIINGLIGKPLFKAGVSRGGSGVSFQFVKKEVPGVGVFMDTPGLADMEKKKQAAEAITTALKQNGFYRIFFVLLQDEGRIRPADKTTMQLILDAAPTITDYSVIVNKIHPKTLAKIDREGRPQWIAKLMSNLPKITPSVKFMMLDDALAGEDDVEYNAPAEIIDFIKRAPGMKIQDKDVSDVKADEFEKLEEKHDEFLKKLEKSNKNLKRQLDVQEEFMTRKIQEIGESNEREAKRMREAIDKAEKLAKQERDAREKEQEKAKALTAAAEKKRQEKEAKNSTWVVTVDVWGEELTHVCNTREEAEKVWSSVGLFACSMFHPSGEVVRYFGILDFSAKFRRMFNATRAA